MTSAHTDAAESHPAYDNSLDDIFGSSPPPEARGLREHHEPMTETTVTASASVEPSDLPSLRRQHVTAGYRDGVSASKGEHVQHGFDAGYPVGAQLGMRAGTILGILEGIVRGLEDRGVVKKPVARVAGGSSSPRQDETRSAECLEARRRVREQILRLYQDAVKGLDVQTVFSGLEAGAAQAQIGPGGSESKKAGERAETQLGRKGDVVITKWEDRVAVPRWEENMDALEMKENVGEGSNEGGKATTVAERS